MAGIIGIIDTDVLIELFDNSALEKSDIEKIILWLKIQFVQIWIPQYVIKEFSITPRKGKRLTRLLEKHSDIFKKCPITIGSNEYKVHLSSIHRGETDAILQTYKAPQYNEYSKLSFTFISNDIDALNYAETQGVRIREYSKDIKPFLNEIGIVL